MSTTLEILHPDHCPKGEIRTVIFDFDGTFSTLRCGWESVMRSLMLELISNGNPYDKSLEEKVDDYIDASTGIQTVHQMEWLKTQVEQAGYGRADRDVWWYKGEYNRRLMLEVQRRIDRLVSGEDKPSQYLISGAVEFLKVLHKAGIMTYLASGTDHKDVLNEAAVLGIADLFLEIKGAPERQVACSKEAVLKSLLQEHSGEHVLIVGDGKVEIALGAENGTYTLGVATDEEHLCGINPIKYARLKKAGADAIIGDFKDLSSLRAWLHI